MASHSLESLVDAAVESRKSGLLGLSDWLWQNPELALKETRAQEHLTQFLESQGFEVQQHWLLETAFHAEFNNTRGDQGPTVALLCEYDALPDIGHACGHNQIHECSMAAATAARDALFKSPHIRGKISGGL